MKPTDNLKPMQKLPDNQKIEAIAPADNNLPGLASLLDTGIMGKILTAHFKNAGLNIIDCRISYIRYKPRTNCIVVYQVQFEHKLPFGGSEFPVYVKIHSAGEYETAAEKTRLHRWANFRGMGDYLLLPDYRAILYFFPNDTVIDGLRITENPKKIQRILYQHYKKFPQKDWRISDRKLQLDIIRNKPERRAVIRIDTKAVRHDGSRKDRISVFARFYADDSGHQAFRLQQKLYQLSLKERRFNIAEPIVYLPDRRIFLMDKLEGVTLFDSLIDGGTQALKTAANALAALHNTKVDDIQEFKPSSLVEKTRASFEMISEITPEFSQAAGRIHKTISEKADKYSIRNKALIHGDFYPGQVIINENTAGIIDFDRSCCGDPIADIGNFTAHLKLMRIKGIINDEPVEKLFIQSYQTARELVLDSTKVDFWTAFSLYQLAVNPFRGLEPGWRSKTELILKECQTMLS